MKLEKLAEASDLAKALKTARAFREAWRREHVEAEDHENHEEMSFDIASIYADGTLEVWVSTAVFTAAIEREIARLEKELQALGVEV